MRPNLRVHYLLVLLGVFSIAAFTYRVELGEPYLWSSWSSGTLPPPWRVLTRLSPDTLILAAMTLPTLLAIILVRRPLLQVLLLAPLIVQILPLLRSCVRAVLCEGLGFALFVLLFQLLFGVLVLIGIALRSSIALWRNRHREEHP